SSSGTIIVFGINQNAVGSGEVVDLFINVPASVGAGVYPLTMSNIVFSDKNGTMVAGGSSTNGTVTLNASQSAPTTVNTQVTSLNGVQVYPNPWRADKHGTHDIMFINMVPNATVKIFNIAGHEVQAFSADGNGQASWNRKNESGDTVGSGIYLYLITDSQGDKAKGKLAIIK